MLHQVKNSAHQNQVGGLLGAIRDLGRMADALAYQPEYFTVRDYRNRQKAEKEKRLIRKAARILRAAA